MPLVVHLADRNGLNIIPSICTYRANIRMSVEHSILSDPNTPGYLERSKDGQSLRSWGNTDLERLKRSSLAPSKADIMRLHELDENSENSTNQNGDFDLLEKIKRSQRLERRARSKYYRYSSYRST